MQCARAVGPVVVMACADAGPLGKPRVRTDRSADRWKTPPRAHALEDFVHGSRAITGALTGMFIN